MKKLLFLFSFLFIFFSCKKDQLPELEPDLPPLTTTGEGTFGCYLNGKPWVAEWFLTPPGGFKYLESSYSLSSGRFGIDATLKDSSLNQVFSLGYLNPTLKTFNSYPEFKLKIKDFYKDLGCYDYRLDTLGQFQSEIVKFDLDERTASGTFSGNLIGEDCNDTIRITEGRFDIRFNIIQ